MTIQATNARSFTEAQRSRRALRIEPLFVVLLLLVIPGCSLRDPATKRTSVSSTESGVPERSDTVPQVGTEDEAEAQNGTLIAAIARLTEHGLDPEDYKLSRLPAAASDPVGRGQALREAWLLAATHLAHGRLDPRTLRPRASATTAERELLARLDAQGGTLALAAALEGFAPQHPTYLALRSELAAERAAMALETDPGKLTDHAAAIDKLRANLERWRWLPRDLGPRYVFANVAGFDVAAFDNNVAQAQFAAIFGKLERETPAFSDDIEYIVFNPWWEVPDSIARNDKLPQFRRDPGAVLRLGYKVLDKSGLTVDPANINWENVSARTFPYRLRQAPGPSNALGQVKIMFPNAHNVYLHDTPDRGLFDAEQRAFSSGCIRVKEPLDLAEWLLRDTTGWDRERIDGAVGSNAETRVTLSTPVPVHVVYFTAVADETCQRARYLADVYNRDAAVIQSLRTALVP